MWQDPHTPSNYVVPGGHNPPPPFMAHSPVPPHYDTMPIRCDPTGMYMPHMPNAMFRPIDAQIKTSSGSIGDSLEAASDELSDVMSIDQMQQQQQMQHPVHLPMPHSMYQVPRVRHNKPFQGGYPVLQPANYLMLPHPRNQFGASSAPTSPRLRHHPLNLAGSNLSLSSSESDQQPQYVGTHQHQQSDGTASKRWSVPSMTPNNQSPVPPFSMQPGVVNNTKPLRHTANKQDSSSLAMTTHHSGWVNSQDTTVAFSSNPSTGQSLAVPMSSYQPNHQMGGNPWALTEETEDQALTPDGFPNGSLSNLIQGLDIADHHVNKLRVSLLTDMYIVKTSLKTNTRLTHMDGFLYASKLLLKPTDF